MQSNIWLVAAIWMGLALAASVLTDHIIDQRQYTILVTTVIGSAIVPTLIAQRLFQPALPKIETTEEDIEILAGGAESA